MKTIYTRTIARKLFLIFLGSCIICAIVAVSIRSTISLELANLSKLANKIENDKSKSEQVLILLHQMENDFQGCVLNPSKKNNTAYTKKLSMTFREMDILLKANVDTIHITVAERNRIKLWYVKKIELSNQLSILKYGFDSLLTVYANYNDLVDNKLNNYTKKAYRDKNTSKNYSDTVWRTALTKKKGIFGRLKDAISNKNEASTSTEINNNKQIDENSLTEKQAIFQNKDSYVREIHQLQQRNIKLLSLQKKIEVLNTHILYGLDDIISNLKENNYNIVEELKNEVFVSYQETNARLNKLYLTALFVVLLFAVLLIIFVIQLNKSEQLLRIENERSVAMAKQKMDLLLYMSHEIRNPLTAIKGFLYIFSKSDLTKKQKEMLNSIRLSSDMLLQTLNDTLDASKMENSTFEINNEPFHPYLTLKLVIESMEFSAVKKNLEIIYNFKGNKDAILIGDNFRLKQILINLLSNAIKYTHTGGVIINASLEDDYRLYFDIIDTGEGINLEQQENLFTKYYQTNSAKGKLGTGLGLFICKELVELQKGKISVKSNPGSGSTFSFFIPYKRMDDSIIVQKSIDDPLLLLNGISILAVDDNELNLLFLKVMLSKWNMKFYQAANGKIAFDIIAKNKIDIILTDLQMPEMDGFELLSAIRNSNDSLLNLLPVIAISGNIESIGSLNEQFSGTIVKPFNEAKLLEQLIKNINKNPLS